MNSRSYLEAAVTSSGKHPVRVCHVAYTFFETDNRVLRYAKALVERGDQVDVIALRRPGQRRTGEDHGVHLTRLQYRTKTENARWTYLVKILGFILQVFVVLLLRQVRRPYDVVHVHNVPDFLVFSALVPKLTGARIVLDIHDILPELYLGKFSIGRLSPAFHVLAVLERCSCMFADYVVVANDLWRDRLIQRSVAAKKCRTFLNYPDLRIFKPLEESRECLSGGFTILYPGSLSHHQGVDIAIRAFALASGRMRDAEFHIYGEGPALGRLVALSQELGVSERVKFLDPLPVDQIAKVMRSVDLGVEPKPATSFSNEALSTKILEFMASGIPVIVSRTAVHDYYFDDTVVRFVAPGDERELARAFRGAYVQKPDVEQIRRAQSLADRYSWGHRVHDYYALVDELCGTPSHREPNRASRAHSHADRV